MSFIVDKYHIIVKKNYNKILIETIIKILKVV
jgi:hypothetical protein